MHSPLDVDTDALLNQVGNPETLIKELRDAYRDRQLRRNLFIDNLSPDVKAEWIDGEAVYHSPAREAHNWTVHGLDVLLGIYSMYADKLVIRTEKAMVEVGENNFEPDVCIWLARDHEFDRDLVVYPRPDIAVEVLSKRTAKRDLTTKKVEYARAGTQEYWVIDADAWTLRQFRNVGGAFEEAAVLGETDELQSSYVAGLRFPLRAIWHDEDRKAWTTQLVQAASAP